MKVLHVSINDTNGCTSLAFRIHRSVLRAGVQSTLLVRDKVLNDPTVEQFQYGGGLPKRAWLRLRTEYIKSAMKPYRKTTPRGYESFTDSRSAYGKSLLPKLADCDILHLHWFRDFIDWRLLAGPELSAKPLLLTLHDTVNFTGGCHYTSGCSRFVDRCGSCPQLGSKSDQDVSRRNWQRKRNALAKRTGPTYVAASSEWMAGEARRSSLLGHLPIRVVYNGIDTETFQPRGKASARQLLSIPPDAAVVMFISVGLNNPRKGFAYLAEALKTVRSSRKIVLLSAGPGKPPVPPNVQHIGFGAVNNELFLSLIYSAADLFVIPSLEENFALTALEASACGLPIIGFNAGGVPELVQDRKTGFVVPAKNSEALSDRISEIFSDPARAQELGANSRTRTASQFSEEIMGRNFRDIYLEMSNPPRSSRAEARPVQRPAILSDH